MTLKKTFLETCKEDLVKKQVFVNGLQDIKGMLRVVLMIRPFQDRLKESIFSFVTDDKVAVKNSRSTNKQVKVYQFNKVFMAETNQSEIADSLDGCINQVINGYNVCFIHFGTSGSGKTYTVIGRLPDQLGLSSIFIGKLIDGMNKEHRMRFRIEASFLEFYNDTLPKPPAFIFMIDVSYASVKSGMVNVICENLRDCILPYLATDTLVTNSPKPLVGFITYDRVLHFYNMKSNLTKPQMQIISYLDNETTSDLVPIVDGFLVDPDEAVEQIQCLMDNIIDTFTGNEERAVVLGPVIEAGMEALKAADNRPGKLFVFHSSLPTIEAPGKLKARDDRSVIGTDKEKSLFTSGSSYYTKLAENCVTAGVSVDLFLTPAAFIDVATLSELPKITGGSLYKYDFFSPSNHAKQFISDLQQAVAAPCAFDAVIRVRTSLGTRAVEYYGNFHMTNTEDVNLACLDANKSIVVEIKHNDKLQERESVYIQSAVLYTSISGQRRLRIHNISFSVSTNMSDVFKMTDLDSHNYSASYCIASVYQRQDNYNKRTIDNKSRRIYLFCLIYIAPALLGYGHMMSLMTLVEKLKKMYEFDLNKINFIKIILINIKKPKFTLNKIKFIVIKIKIINIKKSKFNFIKLILNLIKLKLKLKKLMMNIKLNLKIIFFRKYVVKKLYFFIMSLRLNHLEYSRPFDCLGQLSCKIVLNVEKRCGKIKNIDKLLTSRYGPRDHQSFQIIVNGIYKRNQVKIIKRSTKLDNLRVLIAKEEAIPDRNLRIEFNSKEIKGQKTIEEIGIQDGSTIQVLLKLRGGMDEEEKLKEGLKQKRVRKGKLTKFYNRIMDNIKAEDIGKKKEDYDEEYDSVINEFQELMIIAGKIKQKERVEELKREIKQLEDRNEKVDNMFERMAEASIRQEESLAGSVVGTIKPWKKLNKLKKIEIPVFSGDSKEYHKWAATFDACVDSADGTKEEKIFHLRQYLSGEPLRLIDNLGFSASAYDGALERLKRKYGGKEREYRNLTEGIETFKPIRSGEVRDMERFVELLDTLIRRLTDLGRENELEDGFLYQRVIKKLPEDLAVLWLRWLRDGGESKNIKNLFEWIREETEGIRCAQEEVQGVESKGFDRTKFQKNYGQREQTFRYDQRKTSLVTNFIKKKEFRPFKEMSSKKSYDIARTTRINEYEKKCLCCGDNHYLNHCEKFQKMEIQERNEFVKRENLCFNCLNKDHTVSNCSFDKMCRIQGCVGKHSYWLHNFPKRMEIKDTFKHSMVTMKSAQTKSWISLRTVPIELENNNRSMVVNALLDDASTTSYISTWVKEKLQLNGTEIDVPVSVIGGITEKLSMSQEKMTLKSLDGKVKSQFQALALKTVVGDLRVIDWRNEGQEWPHLKEIPFPVVNRRLKVDVLIGADYLALHKPIYEICGQPNEPIARLTPLGWTCVGGKNISKKFDHQTNFIKTFISIDDETNNMLKNFWEVEQIGESTKNEFSKEELKIQDKVKTTIKLKENRYEIEIPWKEKVINLPNTRIVAVDRLRSLQRRFAKDKDLEMEYKRVIENHEEKGYIEDVTGENSKDQWLLPHFPVIKKDRSSTKVRIVFDAAAKSNTLCLNDLIETGPKLQNDLTEILIRFRRFPIALVCDISEMYLQISIAEKDRPFLRFLWEKEGHIKTYQFKRLVFGLNTSPFLAQLVSRENAHKYEESYPRAVETICSSTYMDDSLDSVKTESEAIILKEQLSEIWGRAGMKTQKWMTNSETVLNTITKEDQAKTLELYDDSIKTVKTLGLQWTSTDDTFKFSVKDYDDKTITKRQLLSWIARIFDPLGMISPYIICGKMLIQEIWMSGVDWDEPLPSNISDKAKQWFDEASHISEVKIPRCLIQNDANNLSLHVFSDASSKAFGAVMYLRETYNQIVRIRFVASKTKVAPVKVVSIPRLELLGACIGVKLAKKISEVLGFGLHKVVFWSDSEDVLYWIKQHARVFKPFVANRVGYIQEDTDAKQWRYVPTHDNPADLLSRGMSAKECVNSVQWWEGPKYLKEDEEKWPKTKLKIKEMESNEIRKVVLLTRVSDNVDILVDTTKVNCLVPETYSCWLRLIRVYAWMLRFVYNISKGKDSKITGELNADEIKKAETLIIKVDQEKNFKDEHQKLRNNSKINTKSRIRNLNPFLDGEGIVRSNSRIINAQFLTDEAKYPIILSDTSWITWLIIRHYHLMSHHYAGINHLLSDLNERFWIIRARRLIKKYENHCIACKKKNTKGLTQIMAPLPSFRFTEPLGVFVRVAVDFAGPFETIQGRGKVRVKRYLCMFNCLQSRAIHLEIAYGLDTDSFIKALLRFIGRRGTPELMLSDNGTNFIGATKELKGVVLDNYKITKVLSERKIRWILNPPAGPHFGGVFESLIKSAKKALGLILGNANITDEELLTASVAVEGLINSRPLIAVNEDDKGLGAITPNHFLRNRSADNGDLLESEISDGEKVRKRWKRMLELREHIWSRWMKELVPTWCSRKKWTEEKKEVKQGDLMWILDRKNEYGKWPLAIIKEVFPGRDCRTRVVSLTCDGKEIIRPISQLIPLELDWESNNKVSTSSSQGEGNVQDSQRL